jgi:hypothetical protein
MGSGLSRLEWCLLVPPSLGFDAVDVREMALSGGGRVVMMVRLLWSASYCAGRDGELIGTGAIRS